MQPNIPQQPELWAIGAWSTFAITAILIGIAIGVVICFFIYNLFKVVPEEHREMDPAMVWLLIIPIFNLIWNFFVFPKLSLSYSKWFQARGDTSAGDCNRSLGLAYAILAVVALVPCLGGIAGLAGLVVLIIYLIKMYELKNRATQGPATPSV